MSPGAGEASSEPLTHTVVIGPLGLLWDRLVPWGDAPPYGLGGSLLPPPTWTIGRWREGGEVEGGGGGGGALDRRWAADCAVDWSLRTDTAQA